MPQNQSTTAFVLFFIEKYNIFELVYLLNLIFLRRSRFSSGSCGFVRLIILQTLVSEFLSHLKASDMVFHNDHYKLPGPS